LIGHSPLRETFGRLSVRGRETRAQQLILKKVAVKSLAKCRGGRDTGKGIGGTLLAETTAMTRRHALFFSILLALLASASSASALVIRDSIGPDSSLTDGMPGGSTSHDGGNWNTPGLVVNAPADGELTQARFVIFARGPGPAFAPENNLANVYGYPMEFHIWTEGVEVGADSFDLNPTGSPVTGHIDIDINTPTTSFINISPFGITGPSSEFTTFLVTIDLSSFDIALEAGTQYVMGLIQDNEANFISGGGFFRVSASRATGFEDVARAWNTNPALRPGYVKTQLGNTFEQYAGMFTLAPLVPGDYNDDGKVDAADYVVWRKHEGTMTTLPNDPHGGTIGALQFDTWRANFGAMAGSGSGSQGATVPEPSAFLLVVTVLAVFYSSTRFRPVTSPHAT
jgi:hypothetical protein